MGRLASLSRGASGVLVFLAIPGVAVLLLGAGWILSLFGTDFQVATLALRLLTIGALFNLAAGPVGLLLMMTGNERLLMRNVLYMASVNALLNMALIPSFGLNGAAAATAITAISINALNSVAVRRRLGFWVLPNLQDMKSIMSVTSSQ